MLSAWLPPATKLGQGNISSSVCQEFCTQWGVCPIACWDTNPHWEQTTPRADTPQSRYPLDQTTPGTRHPLEKTPPSRADSPWSRHPPRTRPFRDQTLLGADPPWSRHPPPGPDPSRKTPSGSRPPWSRPPWEQTPPRTRHPTGSRPPTPTPSGQYASYCNAILLCQKWVAWLQIFSSVCQEFCTQGGAFPIACWDTNPPLEQTTAPPEQTPLVAHHPPLQERILPPWTRPFWEQTPPGEDPLPGADTRRDQTPLTPPLGAVIPLPGKHPLGADLPGADLPGSRHPPRTRHPTGSRPPTPTPSGQYASYCNAILLCQKWVAWLRIFSSVCQEFCTQGGAFPIACWDTNPPWSRQPPPRADNRPLEQTPLIAHHPPSRRGSCPPGPDPSGSRHPPVKTPLPGADTHLGPDTPHPSPGSSHPPSRKTPSGSRPPWSRPPWSRPPWEQTPPRTRHPTGSRPPTPTPSGQYASYCNAILLCQKWVAWLQIFSSVCQEFCTQGGGPSPLHAGIPTPLGADNHPPRADTPRSTPSPLQERILPPWTRPFWEQTPPPVKTPLPGADTRRDQTPLTPPPGAVIPPPTPSGRYASYWNAILLCQKWVAWLAM